MYHQYTAKSDAWLGDVLRDPDAVQAQRTEEFSIRASEEIVEELVGESQQVS